MNYLLQIVCAGAANYYMCTTSLQQAANQTGATEFYGKFTQYVERRVHRKIDPYADPVEEYLKEQAKRVNRNIAVLAGVAYRVYTDRGVVMVVKPGFADALTFGLHPDSFNVQVKWVY